MNNKYNIGKLGERIAHEYLIKNEIKIVDMNHKEGFDELDIVAKDTDGTLLFVEVKTTSFYDRPGVEDALNPEDNMSGKKLYKISRACIRFAAKHPELVDESRGWRIDLIAIVLRSGKLFQFRHYKNI